MVDVSRNEDTVDDYYLILKTSRLVLFIRHVCPLGHGIEITRFKGGVRVFRRKKTTFL